MYYAYSHPLLKYTGVTPLYAIASEPSPFEPSYTPSYGLGVTEVRTEHPRVEGDSPQRKPSGRHPTGRTSIHRATLRPGHHGRAFWRDRD
ncbi:MAG: hypothetical protein U0531_13400 [Dehalococcoidia bacterium]